MAGAACTSAGDAAEVRKSSGHHQRFPVANDLWAEIAAAHAPSSQQEDFFHRLKEAIARCYRRSVDALQVIQELITIAEDLREETNDNLPEEERGFYDALARIDTAREARSSKLRTIIAELVTTSRMRVAVKRIVRKHGWPPDL